MPVSSPGDLSGPRKKWTKALKAPHRSADTDPMPTSFTLKTIQAGFAAAVAAVLLGTGSLPSVDASPGDQVMIAGKTAKTDGSGRKIG